MIRLVFVIVLLALVGCGSKSGKGSNKPSMDPRLAVLADWSYACARQAAELKSDGPQTPIVVGLDAPWGANGRTTGSYHKGSRWIEIWITQPYDDLVDDLLHEMGHAVDEEKNGETVDEVYANWINRQCKESVRPDIYPAPPID